MFVVALPALGAINIMQLHNPQSAILSAVIFNALIIVALIPLALRGVKYRAIGAGPLLSRNLLIYGLGGVVAPFQAWCHWRSSGLTPIWSRKACSLTWCAPSSCG